MRDIGLSVLRLFPASRRATWQASPDVCGEGTGDAQLLVVSAYNFHQPSSPILRKELMIAILAHRIQKREYGALSNSARRKWKQIAKGLRSDKHSPASINSNLKCGARLIRSWEASGSNSFR